MILCVCACVWGCAFDGRFKVMAEHVQTGTWDTPLPAATNRACLPPYCDQTHILLFENKMHAAGVHTRGCRQDTDTCKGTHAHMITDTEGSCL